MALKSFIDLPRDSHFPLENLALSPQCGFASHSRGSALSFGQQEAKLRRVIEAAREVWGG